MASRALMARLTMAFSRLPGSISVFHKPPATTVSISKGPYVSRRIGALVVAEGIETAADAEVFEPADPAKIAFVTQTTLSVDDTHELVADLRRRFPRAEVVADDAGLALRDHQLRVADDEQRRADDRQAQVAV